MNYNLHFETHIVYIVLIQNEYEREGGSSLGGNGNDAAALMTQAR